MTRDVIGHLWKQGEKMWSGINKLLESCGSETKNKFLREEALSKLEAACKEI